MKDKIEQIRSLLDEVEASLGESEAGSFVRNFDALEIPALIEAIVDYLQPELLPYEAAIYWYLFRHSVVATGDQYVRVSTYRLQSIFKSARSNQAKEVSLTQVRVTLKGLEDKAAIIKAGDTTREGTLYKICLPDEIPHCQSRMKEKKTTPVPEIDTKKELDFYNVAENRAKIFERDGYKCRHCGKQLTRFSATLDHIQPVSRGGDNSFDNLTTSCLHCNSERGSRPIMDILTQDKGTS